MSHCVCIHCVKLRAFSHDSKQLPVEIGASTWFGRVKDPGELVCRPFAHFAAQFRSRLEPLVAEKVGKFHVVSLDCPCDGALARRTVHGKVRLLFQETNQKHELFSYLRCDWQSADLDDCLGNVDRLDKVGVCLDRVDLGGDEKRCAKPLG